MKKKTPLEQYVAMMVERHCQPLAAAVRKNLAHRPIAEREAAVRFAEDRLRSAWRRQFEVAHRRERTPTPS